MARRRRYKMFKGTSASAKASSIRITKGKYSCIPATSAAVLRQDLSLSLPPLSSPASPLLNVNSSFDLDLDSDPDMYLKLDTDTELDVRDSQGSGDANESLDSALISDRELDVEPDSEAEAIMRDIARFREDGPAKPRHTTRTTELWMTESKFWNKYCRKLQNQTKLSPEEQLRRCEAAVFKSYLLWRIQNSRIRKESAIEAYWKRISMYYHHVTCYAMRNEILKDVRNWMLGLGLDKTKKEKLAMFVQDLYAILHALWVDDTKPLHGFIRVQISLLLLLSAATATRPGALVESASNKGSNKALCFKDVALMKVRSLDDPKKSTIVANINLEHVKNKEKDGTPKKFTFHLEGLPAFCIVSHMLGIGTGQDAFKDDFISVQQILNLIIPAERNVLRIKWKKGVLDKPFFCDVQSTTEGGRILTGKAFPYWKYRDMFIRLGRVAGFEAALELYQLRRASGNNLNSALTSADRNQTMGHTGDTYERYYTPTHIARDFQSIYFGTPSEEELIRSVASMGLSRDRRAPVELSNEQQEEVRNNPLLTTLRQEREKYKKGLYDQGFYPLVEAKGTALYKKYEEANKEISSTYQKLHRARLDDAIRTFHDSVDTIEIARQLSGKASNDVLTLPTAEFELRERAIIAGMLFKPLEDDRARAKFVRTLARLCHLQETRRPKALKRKINCVEADALSSSINRKKKMDGYLINPTSLSYSVKQEPTLEGEEVIEVRSQHPYPMILPYPVCLLCIGNEEFSYEWRMRYIPRKDVLKKHVKTHFKDLEYQGEFECRHPACSVKLDGIEHFMRHALDKHRVCH